MGAEGKARTHRLASPSYVVQVTLAFFTVSLVGGFVTLAFGPTEIDLGRALTDSTSLDHKKVFASRLPRSLAAHTVGGALSVAGLVFQALIRNPLASPYILGVSSGGSLGAVLALSFGITFLPPFAFLGALGAIALVYAVARHGGRVPASSLLLSGVVVNAFLGAAIMFVNILSEPRNQDRILRWLVGSFTDSFDRDLLVLGIIVVAAVAVVVFVFSRELNLLALGDLAAERSGVALAKTRTLHFVLASLLTAIAVSLCGPIGFVGLIVPHVLRLVLGPDHRILVPAALFFGGTFLALVDLLAQTVWTTPLPAGVLTAVLGGPLFLILLSRLDRARAGLDG